MSHAYVLFEIARANADRLRTETKEETRQERLRAQVELIRSQAAKNRSNIDRRRSHIEAIRKRHAALGQWAG